MGSFAEWPKPPRIMSASALAMPRKARGRSAITRREAGVAASLAKRARAFDSRRQRSARALETCMNSSLGAWVMGK